MRKEGEDGEGETQTPLKLKRWQGRGVMKETGGGRNGDPGSRDKKLKAERERSRDPEAVVRGQERQNQDGDTDQRHEHTGSWSAPQTSGTRTADTPRQGAALAF